MTRRTQRSFLSTIKGQLAAALLGATIVAGHVLQAGAATRAPQPTTEEQALLAQYPGFEEIISVTEANADNGIHAFLAANTGQTVYLDTAILVYSPIPPVITDEVKAKLTTDRFENPVMQKCWTEPGDWFGFADAGPQGYPLPDDDQDIEAGCATRLRLVFAYGDSSPGLEVRKGSNQSELIFTGFFDVAKTEAASGKTLYTLTQKPMDEETIRVFAQFRPTPDRPERPLWLDEESP